MSASRIHVESPSDTFIPAPTLSISGWCIAQAAVGEISVSVNGEAQPVSLRDRPDVEKAFPEDNAKGFIAHVDLSAIDGVTRYATVLIEINFPPDGLFIKRLRMTPELLDLLDEAPAAVVEAEGQPCSDAERRRRGIERHIDISKAHVLEIGAFDNPTYRPGDASIHYMDWFTTQECRDAITGLTDRDPRALVHVDHAIKSKRFADALGEKFDLIIANHVIEHIPDMLRWINELAKCLTENGAVFLSIPDKRYTFDILRADTDAIEFLRCYDEDLEVPTYYQRLRDMYMYRPITAVDVWGGDIEEKVRARRFTLPEAMARARERMDTGESTHCSVFSRDTIEALWDELIETGLLDLEIAHIGEVAHSSNEFSMFLRPRRGRKGPLG